MGPRTIGDEEPSPFAIKDRLNGVGIVDDPHPRLRELRATCPVHHGSLSGLFATTGPDNYIIPDEQQLSVLTFGEVDRAFRDSATFSNAYYRPYLRAVIGTTILEMDPPEHHRFRTLIQGDVLRAGDAADQRGDRPGAPALRRGGARRTGPDVDRRTPAAADR